MPKPEFYMHRALELAEQAAALGEVPVGAVLVDAQGEILGRGMNRCICDADPTAHAEMVALREAGRQIGNYRLTGCTLYVTLEPCTMCIGAILNARLAKLVYGAKEPKTGALASVCNLPAQPWYTHRLEVEGGLLAAKCQRQLQAFFQQRRAGASAARTSSDCG